MKIFIKLLFIYLCFVPFLLSDEYVVISNRNLQTISKSQIKAIFLKKITIINDTKVIPISLGTKDPIRTKFEKKILKMSFIRLKNYWTKQHYLGHRPPISMQSQESIKKFVQKVQGAIGYINAKKLDKSVKEIYRWRD